MRVVLQYRSSCLAAITNPKSRKNREKETEGCVLCLLDQSKQQQQQQTATTTAAAAEIHTQLVDQITLKLNHTQQQQLGVCAYVCHKHMQNTILFLPSSSLPFVLYITIVSYSYLLS